MGLSVNAFALRSDPLPFGLDGFLFLALTRNLIDEDNVTEGGGRNGSHY